MINLSKNQIDELLSFTEEQKEDLIDLIQQIIENRTYAKESRHRMDCGSLYVKNTYQAAEAIADEFEIRFIGAIKEKIHNANINNNSKCNLH